MGVQFVIKGMGTSQVMSYDNKGAHETIKKMMQQKRNLSIKFYTDKNGYPCIWIESYDVAGFKYILNQESLIWIFRYLMKGESDDLNIDPIKYEIHDANIDFQLHIMKQVIESGKHLQFIPLFRETTNYINSTASFLKGKIYFRVKRDEKLIEYLQEKVDLI